MSETVWGVPERIVYLLREIYKKCYGDYPTYRTLPINEDILKILNDIQTEIGVTPSQSNSLSIPEVMLNDLKILYNAFTSLTYPNNLAIPETLESILTAIAEYVIPEPSLYEYCYWVVNLVSNEVFGGSNWHAQTFIVGTVGHSVTSVKLLLSRYTYEHTGIITVSIRGTDSSGHPTGNDLTVGTTDGETLPEGFVGEWREITLTEYILNPNTKYAIVLRYTGDPVTHGGLIWYSDMFGPYEGTQEESYNSGELWESSTFFDFLFEVWGNSS